MNPELIDSLVIDGKTKIVFLIMDGLGGLPMEGRRETELEAARTPNLDTLAREGVTGLLDPITPGITPGSGPAHFALFGYDPLKYNIGRGFLSAAGVGFPMDPRDLYARVNFATLDPDGLILDRRAGRLATETNRLLCRRLSESIRLSSGVEVFFAPEKEHRALLVLRGDDLREDIAETDPQRLGVAPLPPRALRAEAKRTELILEELLSRVRMVLAPEEKANMILLRGYARHRSFPSLAERFRLNALAVAAYPMYRGIAGLLGMEVCREVSGLAEQFAVLKENFDRHDFFFVHVKATDSSGEDGNYERKVAAIEEIDQYLPAVTALRPDVLVVTGDHSTPAAMAAHSWHPVPVLLKAANCRVDEVERFGERFCLQGGLGRMPMMNLMTLALAHAGRLTKYGA
ncbi:MAG: 2,3-bisphosphoglycerate-independent phosphoglycerate mutase [Smithellaceae bacterium]|nr:2,3-bisphosphoglycerate-independent phosphoglycerate mutase [Smithellaceae bacterium]